MSPLQPRQVASSQLWVLTLSANFRTLNCLGFGRTASKEEVEEVVVEDLAGELLETHLSVDKSDRVDDLYANIIVSCRCGEIGRGYNLGIII